LFFPIFFITTNSIGVSQDLSLIGRLWIKAWLTLFLFLALPLVFAWWRGLGIEKTFRPFGTKGWLIALPGLALLAFSAWTMAHEIYVISEWLGIASLREEQIEAANATKGELQSISLTIIWITMAIIPAIAEEFFFRGFVLRSLRGMMKPSLAIAWSALLFGLFHVLSGNILAVERFLPTAALGWLLAWLAWRTHSLIPGMLVHAGHNGLLFSLVYFEEHLRRAGFGIDEQRHLPVSWLIAGFAATGLGIAMVHWTQKPPSDAPIPSIAS
jgi:ABC-2 type transport system permease protein/sodium transport system permease protein